MSEEKEDNRSIIEFNDGWGIGSNIYGWQILKKVKNKNSYQWQAKWYYTNLSDAVTSLIKKQVLTSTYSDVVELSENMNRIKEEVLNVLREHKVEVV